MVFNDNNFGNMELPLEKQLAIIKLAKQRYVCIVNKLKLDNPHNSYRFVGICINEQYIGILNIGMCGCIIPYLQLQNNVDKEIYYLHIKEYIPIFNQFIIYDEAKKLGIRLAKPSSQNYWFPIDNYRVRIDTFNFIIKYLQIKIKENGK